MRLLYLFISLFVLSCFAENHIYVGGDFLLTLEQDNGNLNHIASLVSYDPDEDVFIDTFDGGVFLEAGLINLLVEVPNGIFGTGIFNFVDDDYDYSNSVVKYDNDEDDFETVHDGIYLRNGDTIRHIAGTDDYTFFAGTFDAVEYIDEHMDDDNNDDGDNDDSDTETVVDNIVKLDSDDKWSVLDDPNNVFPVGASISGLAASSDSLFIYASDLEGNGALYEWTEDSGYVSVSATPVDGEIVIDDKGNIGGVSLSGGGPSGGGTYQFVLFDKSEAYSPVTYDLYTFNSSQCQTHSSKPTLVAWEQGFLIATPNVDDDCDTISWKFFNSTTNGGIESVSIPTVDEVDMLVVGDNGDLWVATTGSSEILYLPRNSYQWNEIDLTYFGTFSIYTMVWDNGPDNLLAYGYSSNKGMKLIAVVPDSLPPFVVEKSPGKLYVPGTVAGFAVINDPDDDDYELYIGGTFDGIGHGHGYSNFVRYKQGDYGTPLPFLPPLQVLTSYDSVIFYATTECAQNTRQLPIGYYNKDTKDADVWIEIPTIVGGSGCVTSIAANENIIFIGGGFSVSLPDSGNLAHAVIYYDRRTSTWGDLGIPTTISSSGFSYEIASIATAEVDDAHYVAIGGHFDFTVNANEYHSFALFDLTSREWKNVPQEFDTDTIINQVLIDELLNVYIAGQLKIQAGSDTEGVYSFDIATNMYHEIGNLPTTADSIILYTEEQDDVDIPYIYAGGNFINGTKHTGFVYTDTENSISTPWTRAAATSQFLEFYAGSVTELIYTTGGIGANNTNGYDPTYSPIDTTSSGGMSAWGVVFLVLFLLLLAAVVVGGLGAGGFVYYRKKQTYQTLDG